MEPAPTTPVPDEHKAAGAGAVAAIPALEELKTLDHWVAWRWETVGDRPTKVPYVADNGRRADSTKPSTWRAFAIAAAAYRKAGHEGLGFVVTSGDPFVGIDLDHCRDPETGAIEGWAQAIVDRFDSYTEVTPSRKGLRIWARGKVPAAHHRKGHIEVYDTARFFTLTGRALEGARLTIEHRQEPLEDLYAELWPAEPRSNGSKPAPRAASLSAYEILELARHAENASKWDRLMRGDTSDYKGDHSSADAGLCALAAFYTGDPAVIAQIVDMSGLSRDKWRDRKDYRDRTIAGALELVTETYSGIGGEIRHNGLGTAWQPDHTTPRAEDNAPALADAAYHGLAGEIVRAIEPHSEADPVALLVQLLVAVGNIVGRTAYYRVEADQHHLNINAVLVGDTSKSRKGTSWGHVREIATLAAPEWGKRQTQGLSSGEGLIQAVRDKLYKPVIDKKTGVTNMELVDAGEDDKRLQVVESEFSTPLKVSARLTNTLTDQIRRAYDGAVLQNMTVAGRRATGAHISIIGHITRTELRRYMDTTELANGFANRILWIHTQRSKVLPFGGSLDPTQSAGYADALRKVIAFANTCGQVTFTDEAAAMWVATYPDLSEGGDGLLSAVLGRAEAHVVRLASIYAVLDRSSKISPDHLLAALAIWDFSEWSAAHVWGDALGDPTADTILTALRRRPDGMTRTDISGLFSGHSGGRTQQALAELLARGLVSVEKVPTAGRPEERWTACEKSVKSEIRGAHE